MAVDPRDELLSELNTFNQRLQADNTALRDKVESLLRERNEALRRAGRRCSGAGSENKPTGSGKRGKRDKRARDSGDKENDVVLQQMDVNACSGDRNRKHRRSVTASGAE